MSPTIDSESGVKGLPPLPPVGEGSGPAWNGEGGPTPQSSQGRRPHERVMRATPRQMGQDFSEGRVYGPPTSLSELPSSVPTPSTSQGSTTHMQSSRVSARAASSERCGFAETSSPGAGGRGDSWGGAGAPVVSRKEDSRHCCVLDGRFFKHAWFAAMWPGHLTLA